MRNARIREDWRDKVSREAFYRIFLPRAVESLEETKHNRGFHEFVREEDDKDASQDDIYCNES